MLVADELIEWDASVTPETTQRIEITVPAGTFKASVPEGHSQIVAKVPANTTYGVRVVVIDASGQESPSISVMRTLGDLTKPQPVANLRARTVGVNEYPDDEVPPPLDEEAPAPDAQRRRKPKE